MSHPMAPVLSRLWQDATTCHPPPDVDTPFPGVDDENARAAFVTTLRDVLAVEVADRTVSHHRTPAGLAAHIGDRQRADQPDACPASAHASPGQVSIWRADQAATNRCVYTTPFVVRWRGPVDVDTMVDALHHVVAAHDALRTTFRPDDDGLVADIAPQPRHDVEVVHCADGDEVMHVVRDVAATEFHLARGPLLRVALAVVPADAGGVSVHAACSVHHIVFDAASASVFLDDWRTAYAQLRDGGKPDLGVCPGQQEVAAHHHRRAAARVEDDRSYWTGQLAGVLPVLDLPTDRPRSGEPTRSGDVLRFDLDRPLVNALDAQAADQDMTLFMLLLSAYAVFLGRTTGQSEVVIGTPLSLRDSPEAARAVGYLVNTVALRVTVDADTSLREVHGQVREQVLGALAHRWTPLDDVVAWLPDARAAGRGPLFQTMFVLPDLEPGRRATGEGVPEVDLDPYVRTAAQQDLTMLVERCGEDLRGVLDYDTELFDEGTAASMAAHFRRVLEAVAHDLDRPVRDVALLNPQEQRALLDEVDPGPVIDEGWSVTDRLAAQAARIPESPALEWGDETWTHRELDLAANRLAALLQEHGARVGTRVGILLPRSPAMVVALLAVIRTGASWVPLDPAYPPDRVALMLEDSAAGLVVTDGTLRACLPGGEDGPGVVDLDAEADRIAAAATPRPTDKKPTDEAYVVYTSGSTGRPKGVAMRDIAVTNLVEAQESVSVVGGGSRTLQFMSLSFDVSIMEILGTLCFGGTLVLVDEEVRTDPQALIELVARHRVDRLYLPYIAVHQLAVVAGAGDHHLPALREVASVGEQLVVTPQIREFFTRHRDARLVNMYGPSETHLSSVHHLAGDPADWEDAPPIGHAIPGLRMLAVGPGGAPVPPGVPGELVITGDPVSPGYVGRPEETARRFDHDHLPPWEGRPRYRTGDRVRWDRSEGFRFLGRLDEQITLRGFRIEPAEVESALNDLDGVEASAVAAQDFGPGDRRLVAYLVGDGVPTAQEVRTALRERLPAHLVPAHVVGLDAVPTTPSGKVDRQALPAARPGGDAEPRTAARTGDEHLVAGAWARLLGVESPIGLDVHDDFFAVGGHSVLATELLHTLRRDTGLDLGLAALLRDPSIAGMAATVGRVRETGHAGHTAPDLVAEMVLPPSVDAAGCLPPADVAGDVLLTGATGFLGVHLLTELLARTQARVHCLVRADDADAALRRLSDTADRYGLAQALPTDRVVAVPGDVAAERFGLTPTRWSELADTVDAIHHAAAHINFVAPYASVRGANVDGLVHVLELACEGRLKPVHHMSTVGVFPPEDGPRVVSEDDVPDRPEGLGIGYTQSKWVAEGLARGACERGVPVSVYRMSRVFGDSVTGACQPDDFLLRQIESFLRLGRAPAGLAPTNVLPVDFVAAAVTAIAGCDDVAGRTFHIVHPEQTGPDVIVEAVRAAGHELEIVPDAEWLDALDEVGVGAAMASTAPLMREGALEVGSFVYDHGRTRRWVEACGLSYPDVGPDLFHKVIDFFARTGGWAS